MADQGEKSRSTDRTERGGREVARAPAEDGAPSEAEGTPSSDAPDPRAPAAAPDPDPDARGGGADTRGDPVEEGRARVSESGDRDDEEPVVFDLDDLPDEEAPGDVPRGAASGGLEALVAQAAAEPSGADDASEDDASEEGGGAARPDREGHDPASDAGAAHAGASHAGAADAGAPGARATDLQAAEAPEPGPGAKVDLGPESTPEARARLLAEALAHAEMQEASYRVPTAAPGPRRAKSWTAVALLVTAAVLALRPPAAVVPEPPALLRSVDRVDGLRVSLMLQAEQVEAFRARAGRLPASLEELPAPLSGVRYVRSGNRLYQLVAYAPDGRAIVYDSSAPGPDFAELRPAWRSEDGS